MSCRHDIYQPASHQSLSAKELCFSRRHTTKHCNAHTFLVDQVASHEPHSVGKRALSLDKRALYPLSHNKRTLYLSAEPCISRQRNSVSQRKSPMPLGERVLSLDKRGPLFGQSLSLSNQDSRARVVTVRCNVCCSVCFSKETLTKRKFDAVCCSV